MRFTSEFLQCSVELNRFELFFETNKDVLINEKSIMRVEPGIYLLADQKNVHLRLGTVILPRCPFLGDPKHDCTVSPPQTSNQNHILKDG